MLFGLSIGLGVALVVYLQSGGGSIGQGSAEPPAAAASRASTPAAAPGATETRSAALSAEPEEEYSFFRLLPESEVVVPEGGTTARSAPGPAQEYIIQAGAYSEFADADSVQAELALLGIESKIERAIVGNELYHRVIIGPLSERDEIASTVRRLDAANIESLPPRPVGN
jgi:cell division protein FtsN